MTPQFHMYIDHTELCYPDWWLKPPALRLLPFREPDKKMDMYMRFTELFL